MREINEADVIETALGWAAQSEFNTQATAANCRLYKHQRMVSVDDGSGFKFPVIWCEVVITPPAGQKVKVTLEEVSGGFSPTDAPQAIA